MKYMMKEKYMHAKGGKANKQHEAGESKKKKLLEKRMEKKKGGKR
jgi:hypothetical protein